MIKELGLCDGTTVMVSECDYEELSRHHWHGCTGYALRFETVNGRNSTIYMHRQIMGEIPPKMVVDHIDGNRANNSRSNLRVVSQGANNQNRAARGVSKYKGVRLSNRKSKPWRSEIGFEGKVYFLGRFATEHEAALAYDLKCVELYGPLARLNFIKGKHES